MNSRNKILYKHTSVGLGDLIYGFMSCFYLTKILDYELYLDDGPLSDIFRYPVIKKDTQEWSSLISYSIESADVNPHSWDYIRSKPLDSIFPDSCAIASGQNFALTFFDNSHTREKMANLCPDKTDMVKIFFQHIILTPEAQEAVKSVNFTGYIGVHYRSSRKYPEDALNIKDTSRFISAIRNEINYASSGSKKPILLATDDFDCLESFKGLGLEIVTLFDNTPNHIKDDRSLSIPTFKELWALGTCDSFIISYWSNFSRIACLRTKPKTILVGLDIDFHSGNSVGWYDQMMLKDYDLFTSFNVKPFRDTKLAVWEELLTKHVSNNIIPPEMKNFLIQHDIPFNGDYIKIPSNIKHINIDIGTSYYAPHSQVWLSQNPELLVFGFDAIPESIAEIKRGATLKFKDLPSALETKYLDRFYGIPCALGKESDKEIVFYETTEHSDASSIYVPKFFPHRKRTTVMWRLCDFLRYIDFPVIDYIKIDTQSADYDVITNAGPDLQNRVIWVTIEQQEDQYENVPYNQGDIDRFMISIDFVRVNHPNTKDPTYLNKRLSHLADRCTVYQRT